MKNIQHPRHPPAYADNQGPIYKTNDKIFGIRVKKMLHQVNGIFTNLLADLQNLYKVNGINYSINHFHNTLVRLLTPFELLSHFSIADNSDLFNFNHSDPLNNYNIKFATSELATNQVLSFIPSDLQAKEKQASKNKKRKPYNIKHYFYRKQRTRPVLQPEAEFSLVEWASKRLRQGKRVRRKDLGRRALKLSGNIKGFIASVGWVNRFLNRHPKLKFDLMKVARSNIGVKVGYIDDFSDSEQNVIEKLHEDTLIKQAKVEKEQKRQKKAREQIDQDESSMELIELDSEDRQQQQCNISELNSQSVQPSSVSGNHSKQFQQKQKQPLFNCQGNAKNQTYISIKKSNL